MIRFALKMLPIAALLLTAAAPVPFEARLLAVHNRARADYGAPPLVWDAGLSRDAAAWAGRLAATGAWRHDPDNAREGENLWMGTAGAFSLEEMAGAWDSEERGNFRPGVFPDVSRTGSWHDVGHYTQMVWPATAAVGCALSRGGGRDYLVCRYSPPGNVVGEPMRPLR